MDFNSDSVIGRSNTTVESQGSVELQKDSSGMGLGSNSPTAPLMTSLLLVAAVLAMAPTKAGVTGRC